MMKLLYCEKCGDVFSLRSGRVNDCYCCESKGRYIDNRKVEVTGPCIVLGIPWESLRKTIERKNGKNIKTFIIREPNKTITRKEPSGIPRCEYCRGSGTTPTYVTYDLVKRYHTEEEVKAFGNFMSGQTVMALPDGKSGIYVWDYERWLEGGMKKKVQGEDWD